MNDDNFDLKYRRMLLQKEKKRRTLLKCCFLGTLGSLLSLSLILNLIFNHNGTSNNVTTVNKNSISDTADSTDIFKICIDPGHGGSDIGTEGITGSYEKDISLGVSLYLGEILKSNGIDVVYTRTDDNLPQYESANDSLKDRIKVSKVSKVDLFISIHCNSDYNDLSTKGVETWYKKGDDNSRAFASYLQYYLAELNYTNNRELKTYNNSEDALAVLEKNTSTSALVELGFLSNKEDERYLTSIDGQKNSAKALADAIIDYFNSLPIN